ncbi:hypothetical protein B9G69_014680 [Bdellovibrio sp. SKB1291214]|uniref:aldose epimerase family protein n=1 Tax=Bdellovibrio sp. SKB1291214 TaxID=1732569 RepID=UPI000B515777|nr:hypothetical protein [Bdellovibrio sp. SKB1291214]UYL08287.1 hypothetical protein B9G69_014680 [Bdellovibrio sp. SKB1291214]
MATCEIKSNKMRVQINTKGAELALLSVDGSDHNWVWNAGEAWSRSAPLLFPIVGKLKGDRFLFEEQSYAMAQHGFARESEFLVISSQTNKVVFRLNSSDSTKKIYPFDFTLDVIYEIVNDRLNVQFKVLNTDKKKIYFNFGWHPGFVAPWSDHDGSLVSIGKVFGSRSYLRNGLVCDKEDSFFADHKITLNSELFLQDALVFKDLKPGIVAWSRAGERSVLRVDCGNAGHLGLWTKNLSKFLCIEPWWGYGDDDQTTGQIERKNGIQSLMPQQTWEGMCQIQIE